MAIKSKNYQKKIDQISDMKSKVAEPGVSASFLISGSVLKYGV